MTGERIGSAADDSAAMGPGHARPLDAGHVARVIRTVAAEALRERGLATLVLATAPSPASHLLARWLDPLPLLAPDPQTVAPVARTLDVTLDSPAAWLAAGTGLAAARNGLPVDAAHKGELLLDGSPVPFHPLGDLWGGQVAGWTGHLVVPRALRGLSGPEYLAVEAALRSALEDGARLPDALSALAGELPTRVRSALARSGATLRPPLVPRISPWTPGLNPGF